MIIFANDENTKFCQITLRIKRFIHKRKVVPFYSAKRAVTGFSFIFIYLNRATQQVTTQQSKYNTEFTKSRVVTEIRAPTRIAVVASINRIRRVAPMCTLSKSFRKKAAL